MADRPFMKLWVSDFLGDTLDLDAREIGAYMLLLMAMWQRGGSLPSDEKALKRVARCGREWPAVWAIIGRFFVVRDGLITNKRLTEELQKTVAKSEVNSQSGARGGRAKSLKSNKQDVAFAKRSLSQPEPELEREEDLGSSPPPLNVPREPEAGGVGREDPDLLQRVMAACGAREFPCTSQWMPPAASIHVRRWITDLGLTEDEVVAVAGAEQRRHAERARMDGRSGADPPSGPKALDHAMKALSAEKAAPPMQPAIPRTTNGQQPHSHARAEAAMDRAIDDLRAGRIDSIVAGPFAPGASFRR